MIPAAGAAALALVLSAAPAPTAAPPPAPASVPAAAPAAPPAAPPAAAEARKLGVKKAWDELYLRFSAAKPADYKDPDRKAIAAALLDASRALSDDLVLSAACAEKSAEFAPTVEAWLAAGDANLRLKQGAAAATAYEKAVLLAPANGRALVARADLAMREGEPELAVSLYTKVPAKAAEYKASQEKLAEAKVAAQERAQTLAVLAQADRKIVAPSGEAPEDPNAASNERVCAESMRALCVLVRRCMPEDPGAKSCDAEVDAQCSKVAGKAEVTAKELEACVAGIGKAACEKFLNGARGVSELSGACKKVEAALDRIAGEPAP